MYRRQLTLFVNPVEAVTIEKIRQHFNPVQFALIKSHVTLCRDEELDDWARLESKLWNLCTNGFHLSFGPVVQFAEGRGVLLPAKGYQAVYHHLRKLILPADLINMPEPHITLIHPRNGHCNAEIFSSIQRIDLPKQLYFDSVSLIEQIDGGVWNPLQVWKLQ